MPHTRETSGDTPKVKHVLDALLEARLPPRPLWQRFLQIGHDTLQSEAGVLWVIPPNSEELLPQGMCGNAELRQAIVQRDMRQVAHVLQAAATDETVIQHLDATDEPPWKDRALLAVPVHVDGQLFGVLEFIQSPGQEQEFLAAQTAQLNDDIQRVEQSDKKPADSTGEDEPFWREFEDFSYNIHRSLVLSEVADVAVNDGKHLLRCDRMSIAVLRGKKNKILAVAGQDVVNRRSEEVRSLEKIAEEAVTVGEIIEFSAETSELAPHLRHTLSRHVDLTAANLILAIPLYAPSRRRPGDKDQPQSEPIREIVGCLLIEQFRQSQLDPERAGRVQILADAAGSALANARAQQQILLEPTRRLLGRGLDFFRGRTLAKTLAVLGVILAVTISMIIVPWEYRVEAEGRLMPEIQRHIFARWDGVIQSIEVENGQRVQKGDILLTMYNDELHEELVTARNELLEKQQQKLSLFAELQHVINTPTDDSKTESQLRGQIQEIRLQIAGLEKQITILTEREQSLTLTSPIDGIVATFQLTEKLQDRPVSRGEHLLEVMDDSDEWVLELEMPEHRMGHLLRAAQAGDGKPLDVEYVLATDPEDSFIGQLQTTDIATRSEVKQDSGVVVRIQVETDKRQLPFQRIGGEATAKVACGQKSLGYVLFGDVWEFILRYAWI